MKNELSFRVHEVPKPIICDYGVEIDQGAFKAKKVPKSHNAPHVVYSSTKKLTEPKEPNFHYGKGRGENREDDNAEVILEGRKSSAFNYMNQDFRTPDVSNFYDTAPKCDLKDLVRKFKNIAACANNVSRKRLENPESIKSK